MTMVKSELINKIAGRIQNLSLKDVELGVNSILECMSDALSQNERVEIRGFGSFSLHYRPPRNAHNPKTGAKVATLAKYTPHFKPGKELREEVNKTYGQPLMDEGGHEDDSDD